MQEYPFTFSMQDRALLLLIGGTAIAVQCALLVYYTSLSLRVAFVDSLLSVLFLGTAAYIYGFVMNYVRMFHILAILAIFIQWIGIGITFIGVYLTGLEEWEYFAPTIPLRFLIGLLVWAIIAQGYDRIIQSNESREESLPEADIDIETTTASTTDSSLFQSASDSPPSPDFLSSLLSSHSSPSIPSLSQENQGTTPTSPASTNPVALSPEFLSSFLSYPDRLSVKDGSRIHIIPVEDIFYLQACGDYVTVVTASGQYVKEQTMKYFETHLPPTRFIRIHRSYIVNAAQILRIELFGKENYHIRLHNGVNLRASLTGYKLLKERLSL